MFKVMKKCTFVCLLIVTGLCYMGYRYGIQGEKSAEALFAALEPSEKPEDKEEKLSDDVSANQTVSQNTEPEKREFQRVEMDYLKDALFIGDSRTSTLYEYAKWEETDFFVKYGMSVWNLSESKMDDKLLSDVLSEKKYGKIYIMLGINELGTGTPDSFYEQYKRMVDEIRYRQPEALIFIQSIMHVSKEKDEENTYINNAEIDIRNEKIKQMADNINIFYLNVNEAVDDPETGKLNSDYSFDGVHLEAKYIDLWQEYLLNHGIVIKK